MEYEEFKKILKENKLTVKEFSKLSGVSYRTCNNWSKPERKVSDWVESWLNLYIENQKLKSNSDADCEKYKELARAFENLMKKDK
jgi:DNA-binding transcriptional regulator YiaG